MSYRSAFAITLGALAMTGSATAGVNEPAAYVDPLIGTSAGGNTFPGAVVPFGMLAWSPENTRGDAARRPAPGGYQYQTTRVRGFSLTHLSGTGCRGASGDVPFMPHVGAITSSPSLDRTDRIFASRFAHANETASPGFYSVRLASGVKVELTATPRTGRGRFSFPPEGPAFMLVRASDSEVGSSDATVEVDVAKRTVSGSVTSGNFCGYLDAANRRSYYTVHFVAVFDQPITSVGAWQNDKLTPGATIAKGGTTYGTDGYPPPGRGSGVYLGFPAGPVEVRVGISYVSRDNARANLAAENQGTFQALQQRARESWNRELGRIAVRGGTARELTTFYTALYHALLHPNLFSDANGDYRGFDQKVHRVQAPQKQQYANFSGWDVYRSQLQLVTLLDAQVGSDIAQSLFNQATQNGGEWDRWTHNSGGTHVMTGDPSAPSLAGILAFGGKGFDVAGALRSLVEAASTVTPHDLSREACEAACIGQRPSLDKWLKLHYIPTVSNSWGGAGETLETVTAEFALAQMALRLGQEETHSKFLERSGYWRNVFNPRGTARGGYIQNRNEDGTWPALDPADDAGFAEGSSAQYTWMLPFNPRGLIEVMGGNSAFLARLDAFFKHADGGWALTGSGGLHAEMDNEPSVGAPWLYLYAGRPHQTQQTVREVVNTLWSDKPDGIPGNDDLGAMSSWYVFAALGMYPAIPGRAELLLASPLFPQVTIRRAQGGPIVIKAPQANANTPYVSSVKLNGRPRAKAWLPESFVSEGGTLEYRLSATPSPGWGTEPPPSFPAENP